MRKVILILLFTVFYSSFSLAKNNETFKLCTDLDANTEIFFSYNEPIKSPLHLQVCSKSTQINLPWFLMLIEGLNKKVRIDNILRLTETVWDNEVCESLGF